MPGPACTVTVTTVTGRTVPQAGELRLLKLLPIRRRRLPGRCRRPGRRRYRPRVASELG
jgi:hypothetical protein